MGKHSKKKQSIFKKIYKCRRLIFLIIIIILIILVYIQFFAGNDSEVKTFISSLKFEEATSENVGKTIEIEETIITIEGQTLVDDADGYTTLFTSSNYEYSKTYTEYKQNLGTWAANSYWGGTMEENGCGITSIAIIASGYGFEITPEDLRAKYFPHLNGDKIPSAIQKIGIECTDFYYDIEYLNESYISDWLNTGRPVMICLDNSKENIWTTASHYMVLLDINDGGQIYVSNPNGLDDSEKASRMV